MTVWRMPARSMMPDGEWYCIGAPSINVVAHDAANINNWHNNTRYMTNREWCYHAECDLIIFAHLYGDVVVTPEDEESESDYYEETGDEDDSDSDDMSIETVKPKTKKAEVDEVTNWPQVLERMENAHWAFDQTELEAHWKHVIVPRICRIREAHDRKKNAKKINIHGCYYYNALAGLAATCHTRNVDPADHPHGYGKGLPTVSELYLERVCQEFGGKSAQVIKEQEQALKQGRVLKKVKRGGGGGMGREDEDGDLVMGDG
ncbi:hypothetical protein PG993_004663 [Apiospora rasikravindrae]|uniref:Uncharacterized protein n=1 Tax=Apiospora rasikravindrae TaxID=990691 RepID=A0ABR1TDG5_9PEZI